MAETVTDPILAAMTDSEWNPPVGRQAGPNPFALFAKFLNEHRDVAKAIPLTLEAKEDKPRKNEMERTLRQLRRAAHDAGCSVRAYVTEPNAKGECVLHARATDRITVTPNTNGAEVPAAS